MSTDSSIENLREIVEYATQQSQVQEEEEPPARPLVRCFSALPGRTQLPTRRFSLAKRPTQQRSSERSLHAAFTNAWLSTSNFDLQEQPAISPDIEVVPAAETADEEMKDGSLERQESIMSIDSQGMEDPRSAEELWIHNGKARSSMLNAMSGFYCLFITIFALVLELSHLLSGETRRQMNTKDMIFEAYMYGVSIIFFAYMYIVLLLNPRWYSTVASFRSLLRCFPSSASSESLSSAAATVRRVTHSSPSAGSLFLRLGAIVFGVVGLVYYAFLVFLCSVDKECSGLNIALDICAIIFIFTQMHFIFCNWKLTITGSHFIARVGTMHLVAANLWTWIRYILMEEGVMEKEIREVFAETNKSHSDANGEVGERAHEAGCYATECMLGSLSEAMYTAIVEYSLIAAAVMYIVWRNIGRVDSGAVYTKRKHQIRVDCSKTTTGLFLGLAFLAATFASMVVYYGFSLMGQQESAAFVYALTDIFQYIWSTIGCIVAIYQMRSLRYLHKKNTDEKNDQELLDEMLLTLGLVGELIYSVAGLVGLTGDAQWEPLTFILLFVHIFRLIQVGLQTFLLYMASRVKVRASEFDSQPGKQAITFLLTANLAIFLMNLFESEKAGVSEIIVDFYGKRSWVFLVRSFSPLTIFYRFHSSVCLAEIWKNVYAKKGV